MSGRQSLRVRVFVRFPFSKRLLRLREEASKKCYANRDALKKSNHAGTQRILPLQLIVLKLSILPARASSHRRRQDAGREFPNCRYFGCALPNRLETPEGCDKADLADPPGFVGCPRPDRRRQESFLIPRATSPRRRTIDNLIFGREHFRSKRQDARACRTQDQSSD